MDKLPLDLPTRLETDRLILRPYTPEDAPAYLDVCRNNRQHLLPYEADNPAASVETLEQAEALMREFHDGWYARKVFFFGAWEKAGGAFAVQIYLGIEDLQLPEFALGYFVDSAHEGRGFVTEAARAALGFTFEHLHAHRVRLWCNETNTRSWRVAERLGFVREGFLRETNSWIPKPDGGYSGDYIYGLLRREFETQG